MVPVRPERKWSPKNPVERKQQGFFVTDSCMTRDSENPDFGPFLIQGTFKTLGVDSV